MLSFLSDIPQTVERATDRELEPARPAYFTGKPGQRLGLLLRARRDLLHVWRQGDYAPQVSAITILGRQITVVNSPEAIRHVMAVCNDNYQRKSPQMRRALEYLLGDGLFISDGEVWEKRRPLVTSILHKKHLSNFGPIMSAAASRTAERWTDRLSQDGKGARIDVHYEMTVLTAEIIARSIFGNALGSDEAREIHGAFTSYQGLIDSINIGYFLGFDEGLPILRTPRLIFAVRRLKRVIDRQIAAHLVERREGRSMIEGLASFRSRGGAIDGAAIHNEAATIFMAGYETTAATLSWAWYLLSRAPWTETALHREIDAVCGDRVPTVDDVRNLNMCRAIVEETLRLYPPVPILARQSAAEDMIGDVKIPAASLVMIVPWLLHRSEAYFPEPHRFRPERFLERPTPAPYTYIPFAAGPRLCPGLQFGLTEAILCLAILAQRFRLRVVDGHKVEPQCRLTLRPRGGLPMTLQAR